MHIYISLIIVVYFGLLPYKNILICKWKESNQPISMITPISIIYFTFKFIRPFLQKNHLPIILCLQEQNNHGGDFKHVRKIFY